MSKKETQKHISEVRRNIMLCIGELSERMTDHDQSKLEEPEASGFAKVTKNLKSLTYGSEEYKEQLKEMKPFLDYHYENNRHHPEFFINGIQGMTLIDILEMLMDWLAATKRHADGNIMESIIINQKRFGYSHELGHIFINTIEWIEDKKFDDFYDTKLGVPYENKNKNDNK